MPVEAHEPSTTGMVLLGLFLVSTFGGLIAFKNICRSVLARESIDSPEPGLRWTYRYFIFSLCFFFSFVMLSPVTTWQLMKVPRIADAIPGGWLTLIALIVLSLPGALVSFHFALKLLRWGDRRKIKTRRAMGYHVPPARDFRAVPAPATFARDVPGSRMHEAKVSPSQGVDTGDRELIREAARKHWQAINDAAAAKGDLNAAAGAQARFFDFIDSLPKEEARRVMEVYSEASVPHAAEMARIAERQTDEIKAQVDLRARAARNARTLVLILGGIYVVAKLLWYWLE